MVRQANKTTRSFIILGYIIILTLILMLVVSIYNSRIKEVPFDIKVWNSVDEHVYPKYKYKMAIWLVIHYDFIGKDSESICIDLYAGNYDAMQIDLEKDVITIPLRNRSEKFLFFEYYDEHVFVIDSNLKIYLKNNVVYKVEIEELKDGQFIVTKSIDG